MAGFYIMTTKLDDWPQLLEKGTSYQLDYINVDIKAIDKNVPVIFVRFDDEWKIKSAYIGYIPEFKQEETRVILKERTDTKLLEITDSLANLPTLTRAIDELKGKITWVYKDLDLDFSPSDFSLSEKKNQYANVCEPAFQSLNSCLKPKEILNRVISFFPLGYVKAIGKLSLDSDYMLCDEEAKISIKGIETQENVPEGSEVAVEGHLTYNLDMQRGGIYAKIEVINMRILKSSEDSKKKIMEELMEKLKNKKPKGFSNHVKNLVEKINNNEIKHISVLVIHSSHYNTQVHEDFKRGLLNALPDYEKWVDLEYLSTFLNDEELSKALNRDDIGKYHMVYLLRGGGDEKYLREVGGFESARIVLEKNIPLYVAIGHSLDVSVSMMEKVAEYTFPTPSIAGMELGMAIRQFDNTLKLEREKEKLEKEKEELEKTIEVLKKVLM